MCEPVGVAELAERLGVKQQTAAMWRYRDLLPEPKWTVSRQPAWDWADVAQWAQETGRLRDSSGTTLAGPRERPGRRK